jgi:hypothetical protein
VCSLRDVQLAASYSKPDFAGITVAPHRNLSRPDENKPIEEDPKYTWTAKGRLAGNGSQSTDLDRGLVMSNHASFADPMVNSPVFDKNEAAGAADAEYKRPALFAGSGRALTPH